MTIWPDKQIVGDGGVSVNRHDASTPKETSQLDIERTAYLRGYYAAGGDLEDIEKTRN